MKDQLATDSYDIIRRPIITEKATLASENNTIAFEVSIKSTKKQIKGAIENLFNVKVDSVNTLIVKGKVKRFRGKLGKRRNLKKAYVTLVEGNTIDVSTGLLILREIKPILKEQLNELNMILIEPLL